MAIIVGLGSSPGQHACIKRGDHFFFVQLSHYLMKWLLPMKHELKNEYMNSNNIKAVSS